MPARPVYDADYMRLPGAQNWLVLLRPVGEPTAPPWGVVVSRVSGRTYAREPGTRHFGWLKGRTMRAAPASMRAIHAAARRAVGPELGD